MAASNGRGSCGRRSFTTVVDAVEDGPEESARDDPFDGGYIEVDERELGLVSAPAVLQAASNAGSTTRPFV